MRNFLRKFFIFCTFFPAIKSDAIDQELFKNIITFLTNSNISAENIFTQEWPIEELKEAQEMLIEAEDSIKNILNSMKKEMHFTPILPIQLEILLFILDRNINPIEEPETDMTALASLYAINTIVNHLKM